MEKQVGLNQGSLVLDGTQIDVGGYDRIMTGRYSDRDIEDRKEQRIYNQLWQEGLFVQDLYDCLSGQTSSLTKEGERKQEELRATIQPDSYLKYLILLYSGSDVDYEGLRQKVHDAIPNELKDSINVEVHEVKDFIFDPRNDGIEIMLADDVELIVRQ